MSDTARLICPRCGGETYQIDDGPDGYDDDITYVSHVCDKCGLKFDGWYDRWEDDGEVWTMAESGT